MTEKFKQLFILPKEFYFPITVTVGALITVASSVWSMSSTIYDFRKAIDKRFDCIERRLDNMSDDFQRHYSNEWGSIRMERWSYGLEKENRSIGLSVPDPKQY